MVNDVRPYHGACEVRIYTHGGKVYRFTSEQRPCPLMGLSHSLSVDSGVFAGPITFQLYWTEQFRQEYGGTGWNELFTDNDWIEIYAIESGRRDVVNFGLIDAVTRSSTIVNGAEVVAFTVQARSWAKVIDDTQVWFCEWGPDVNLVGEAVMNLLNWAPGGAPSDLCWDLLRGFLKPRGLATGGTWVAPDNYTQGALRYHTMLDLLMEASNRWVSSTRGYAVVVNEALGSTYSLAEVLRNWGNLALNELFFDLRPLSSGVVGPAMILRERPYPVWGDTSPSAWASLPIVGVDRSNILEESLTKSGQARYNVFSILSQIDPLTVPEQQIVLRPFFDTASMQRHGLKKYEHVTRFGSRLNKDSLVTWQNLLMSWYGVVPALYEGTFTLRVFDPKLRPGRRIQIRLPPRSARNQRSHDPSFHAYLSGVSWQWAPLVGWTTSLQVQRGWWGEGAGIYNLISNYFAAVTGHEKAPSAFSIVPATDDIGFYTQPTDLFWRRAGL